MGSLGIFFFICILILVYGGLHYYLYRKLRTVLPKHNRAIIITLVLLAGSVIVVEAFIHNQITVLLTPLAWVSFFWMGLVVLFFGVSLPIDLLTWLVQRSQSLPLARRVAVPLEKRLSAPIRTVVVVVVVVVLGINGVFTAQQINVERESLASAKLSRPLRLVQITDLHVGTLTQKRHLQNIVDTINKLDADIIVSTGDLIDMSTDNSAELVSQLAGLQSRLGKFAVYGNHETFVGLEKSRQLTELAGFTLLSNRGSTLDGVINLFGVDDPSVVGRLQPGIHHPDEPTPAFTNTLFTVLLKHQPVVAPGTAPTFDLQLSGHVHGGQIYPFGLITRLVYPVPMGLSRLTGNSWLYVSYGAGAWGPPMRVFAPPEITLFQLQPIAASQR